MQFVNSTLIVFARAPVIGQVKTRLAEALGNTQTLVVYEQLLERSLQVACGNGFERICCYTDEPAHVFFHRWKKQGMSFAKQYGKDLGERMFNAMNAEFKSSECVALMGSDCAELTVDMLNRVKNTLRHKHVIIPANDGGYVLIGFQSQVSRSFFENIDWGSSRVLSQTLEKMNTTKQRYKLFPSLQDIDTIDDYSQCYRHRMFEKD